MASPAARAKSATSPSLDADSILAAVPNPVLLVDPNGTIRYVNQAAEHFFTAGAPHLLGITVADIVPYDSPLLALLDQVRREGMTMSEYAVDLGTPKTGPRLSNITVALATEAPETAAIVP